MKLKNFIIIVVPFLLLGCTSTNSSRHVFGFVAYSSSSQTKKLFSALQKEFHNARFILVESFENSTTQIQQIETFASQNKKISGIFIQMTDSNIFDEAVFITQNKYSTKIPTVFLEGRATLDSTDITDTNVIESSDDVDQNSDDIDQDKKSKNILKSKHLVAQVQSLSKSAGTLQAQGILALSSNKSAMNIAVLSKSLNDKNEAAYIQEIDDTFLRNSNSRITHQQPANSKRIEAINIVTNWLRNNEKIHAIITSNTKMGLGASIALQEQNIKDSILVASIGGDDEALKAIQNKNLDMTLLSNIPEVAKISSKVMEQMLANEDFQKITEITPLRVTLSNIKNFLP